MAAALREDIQGLRALAVALVVAFHLPHTIAFAGGFVGVDIFFVISGFVVTKMILASVGRFSSMTAAARDFLRRRALRLIPALSVVVIVTVILTALFAPVVELGPHSLAGLLSELFVSNGYYARNFDTYWDPAVLRSPFLHMWSLGVEFQTYLVFPLVFALLLRSNESNRDARTRTVTSITIVLSLISAALFIVLLTVEPFTVRSVNSAALAFYTPVTRFWEFGLGIVPAILSRSQDWAVRPPIRGLTIVAWALLIAGIAACSFSGALGLGVIPACIGTAFLLVQGDRRDGARGSFLNWKPLTWIGDRSYSIYLWHWPFLVLALWLSPGDILAASIAVVLAVLASIVTYRWVELRFRRLTRSGWRGLRPVGLFVLGGLLASVLGIAISVMPWYSTPYPAVAAATPFDEPAAGPTGQQMDQMIAECDVRPDQIHCASPGTAGEVVIVGDSLAYRAFPALALAAKEHGLGASILWTGGCGIEVDSCGSDIYDYLASTDVTAIVVIANFDRAADRVNGVERAAGEAPECPVATVDCVLHQQEVARFSERAEKGLAQLEDYSGNLLVALPFPQQKENVDTCLSRPLYQRITGVRVAPLACGRTSVTWQIERQGLFPAAIEEVTRGDDHVTLWDPRDYLCTDEWCPAVINDGERLMQDPIHWSWEGSRFLYPEFDRYLDEVAG